MEQILHDKSKDNGILYLVLLNITNFKIERKYKGAAVVVCCMCSYRNG